MVFIGTGVGCGYSSPLPVIYCDGGWRRRERCQLSPFRFTPSRQLGMVSGGKRIIAKFRWVRLTFFPEDTARQLFSNYIDAGGNFVDPADLYTNGTSESWLGKFVAERHLRDRVVIATKFTFNAEQGNPNAGGNGRKNILRAVEGSLKRLGTDYIDLYILHTWDQITPAEEVMRTLDDLACIIHERVEKKLESLMQSQTMLPP